MDGCSIRLYDDCTFSPGLMTTFPGAVGGPNGLLYFGHTAARCRDFVTWNLKFRLCDYCAEQRCLWTGRRTASHSRSYRGRWPLCLRTDAHGSSRCNIVNLRRLHSELSSHLAHEDSCGKARSTIVAHSIIHLISCRLSGHPKPRSQTLGRNCVALHELGRRTATYTQTCPSLSLTSAPERSRRSSATND
ncbi:hypothetical protein BU16DRAFT_396864 [Lophium mytilinum]|uniref:Uncharacterized protein n=1 Tax=Lophium mytilinum TaxID=390894 RepID=A0A6A6QT58_9PEZI|nr:hypothetical protein BU16DRAFT_396864 [Lophium mytilinum]